jgi:hypothetical protein
MDEAVGDVLGRPGIRPGPLGGGPFILAAHVINGGIVGVLGGSVCDSGQGSGGSAGRLDHIGARGNRPSRPSASYDQRPGGIDLAWQLRIST